MPKLLRSAAYRIALFYALGFGVATLVLGGVIMLFAHLAFMRQLEGQIVEDSVALAAEYRLEGQQGLDFAIAEREASNPANELLYAVYARDGRRISGTMDARRPSAGWSDIGFTDPREGADEARAWAVDLAGGPRLVVAADRSVVERVDQSLGGITLAACAIMLVLNLAGALVLGAYLRRRLSAISATADRIITDGMSQRVPENGSGDEFDALAHSINRMLDRIATLVENLRQVSSDIAHDLRTPLARLRTHLEDSLNDGGEGQRERLESAVAQTDHVLALFAAMLRIAEIEDGQRRASFRAFDLSALVEEIVESYIPAVEEGGRTLTADIAPGVLIQGDVELLAQALINLLDNAQIHTPVNTAIHVALKQVEGWIALEICDNGPGVPRDAQEAIFLRFVRLNPARSVAGHGLGLNLVAAIVKAHDGMVAVSDNGPGLCIHCKLPFKTH